MDNGIVGRTKGITHSFGGDGISSVSLPAVQQYQPKLNLWQRIAQFSYKQAPVIGRSIAKPFQEVGNKAEKQFKYLSGPTATDAQRKNIMDTQRLAQQASKSGKYNSATIKAAKSSGGSAQGRIATNKLLAKGAPAKTIQSQVKQDTAAYNKNTAKGAGDELQIASYAIGGKTLGLSKLGATSALKSAAKVVGGEAVKNATAAAGFSAGSQLSDKNKVNVKQTVKDTLIGTAFSGVTSLPGLRQVFSKGAKAQRAATESTRAAQAATKTNLADESTRLNRPALPVGKIAKTNALISGKDTKALPASSSVPREPGTRSQSTTTVAGTPEKSKTIPVTPEEYDRRFNEISKSHDKETAALEKQIKASKTAKTEAIAPAPTKATPKVVTDKVDHAAQIKELTTVKNQILDAEIENVKAMQPKSKGLNAMIRKAGGMRSTAMTDAPSSVVRKKGQSADKIAHWNGYEDESAMTDALRADQESKDARLNPQEIKDKALSNLENDRSPYSSDHKDITAKMAEHQAAIDSASLKPEPVTVLDRKAPAAGSVRETNALTAMRHKMLQDDIESRHRGMLDQLDSEYKNGKANPDYQPGTTEKKVETGFSISNNKTDQVNQRIKQIDGIVSKAQQVGTHRSAGEMRDLMKERKSLQDVVDGKKSVEDVYPSKRSVTTADLKPKSKSIGADVGEDVIDYPVSRPKAAPKAKEEIKLNGDGNFTPKSVGEKLRAAVSSTKAAANPLIRLGNQGHIAAANVAKKVQAGFTTKGRQSIADLSAIEAQMKKDGLTEADLPRIREEGANADTQTAKLLHKFLDDYKKDVTANDLVKGVKDNYFPRHAQFEQSILKRARGLSKTSSNTKNRAQLETQDEYGLTHTTDKYQTHAQFEAGVEGYGGKTLSPLASLKQMSQNIDMNVRNAKLLDQLKTTAMGDGNAAVVSGLKKPSGPYVAVEKLPGQFVHKDVAPLLETLSKPESKTGSAAIDAVGDLNSATKRLVTYNAGVHGKNFVIGDMRNRGWKAFVPFTDHYGEADVKRAVAHGFEPFNAREIQQFDDMVTRHMTGPLGSKIEALRGKADSLLFDRFGNSRGMHTFISVEKELTRMQKYVPGLKDLTSDEISSLAARSAKDTMMMSSPIERSLGNRQISRVVFFAGQFVQNTAQLASKAIGLGTDKTLSKGAQKAEQILAVKRIVRGSSYLFAGAQAMNMATTGHPTWENRGSKVLPVFYVDKSTGKEYHLTNFYGQLGDALGLVTDPKNFVSHKISPGLREVGQMLSNKDALGGDITDKTASGPRQSMQFIFHALGDLVTPAGVGAPDIKAAINKTGPPGATNIGRLLGYGVSAKDQNDTDKLVDKLYQGRFGNAPLDPKQQALISQEAKARQDVKNGNTNSANVQAVKGAMSAAQFTKFIKSGGSGTTQRHFDSLPTEDKLKVINTLGTKDLQAIDVTSAAKSIATNKNAYEALIQKGETDQTIKQTLQKAGYDASKLNDLVRSTKADAKARARASRGHKSAKWTSPATQ